MRGRAWRRHKEELIVKKRLGKIVYQHYWRMFNLNQSMVGSPTLIDFIGKKEHFLAKTLSTESYDTKNKVKFSPNKNKNYWRDFKNQTREHQKKIFFDILKENGLK